MFHSSLKISGLIFFLVFLAQSVFGQTYQFKEYNIEEGLSHPFVYTINEDVNGFLWIGTGEGLCRYDGYNFMVSEADDTLASGFVTSSFLGSNGTLWFGHNSGEITYYDGVHFERLETNDLFNSSITAMDETSDGTLWIASQNNGLIRVDKNYNIDTFQQSFQGKIIYALKTIDNNQLLVGTSNGLQLFRLHENYLEEQYAVKELSYIPVQSIDQDEKDNTFWIGTGDAGFYKLTGIGESFDSYELTNTGERYGLEYENVQSVTRDNEGRLWISTFGSGIYRLTPGQEGDPAEPLVNYSTRNGLSNNFIKQVYQDWEGNVWVATYGNGLAYYVSEALSFLYKDLEALQGNILSLEESDTNLFLGGENVMVIINKQNNQTQIIDQRVGLPADKITSLYLDPMNNLWIGTANAGVYQMNLATNRITTVYKSSNSLENNINCITGQTNLVYIGTKNGVVVYDIQTGEKSLYNTSQGLPHNDIKCIFIDHDNNPWIGTKSNGIFVLNQPMQYTIAGSIKLEFTAITQDVDGHIWAATYGDGVFKFIEDTIKYFSTDNGLKSNYCYSLIADDRGKVWVGHRLAMSSIDIESDEVVTLDKDQGITGDCNYNAVLKQEDGVILTGTTNGLVRYDSSKDREVNLPPKVSVTEILFSDEPVDFSKPINLPYQIHKLRIRYVGLSYSNPEGVTYQYKLEGYDLDWSEPTTSREAYYPRIEDGNYTFKLKACNADGNCIEEPLEIQMVIRPPFWKTWWFITLAILIGVSAIYFFIKFRERKQKQLQEYLEKELDARTREVVKQKEILEIKNRDITDSINYAQRIQSSILPSVKTISDNFSGAFVYFKPRDIVSGDFYWYDKVNKDKFLIVCADSTGHGVPGAFMSMIGTTLIKDICLRSDVDSPSEVLKRLDQELQGTLNQNIDAERANDGMDIIVCEIDVNTHYMRFSSAMRPLVLYKDKELKYVRGNKASIGGDPKAEKQFENIGFQLNVGDIVYMFSDGYPDQFGGPRGKKFKMDRVKNMLADVCDKPMQDQHDYVANTFDEWRGKLQQVDDVLFMGVKI
ncbi:MAG: two-component regulator propeller domain-containing protein [Bacteroidales bacterium]|jgi:ligand-binding sensor domain-containing protein/serine phosphatase RsbU (regulator of sigma subunit)|nr:two-component regulator propeller domain-containing protein [Bacteroidales bacterium]